MKNVDSTLSRRLTLSTTEATPILHSDGDLSCFDVIDDYFRPTSSLSEEEKKRRKIFKGKCFRSGSTEHMQPACKLPSSITCNVCRQPGHISPVCSQSANARAIQQDSSSAGPVNSYPAIQYLPDGATNAQPSSPYVSTSAYMINSSLPTPELPL